MAASVFDVARALRWVVEAAPLGELCKGRVVGHKQTLQSMRGIAAKMVVYGHAANGITGSSVAHSPGCRMRTWNRATRLGRRSSLAITSLGPGGILATGVCALFPHTKKHSFAKW
jgi:hypothetical protein